MKNDKLTVHRSAIWIMIVSLSMLVFLLVGSTRSTGTQSAPASGRPTEAKVGDLTGSIGHGRYLAEQVAMCVECHSERDARGNIIESRRYLGAPIPFAPPWPNDWAPRAPRNRGLPGYDDAQALRLLTEGAIDRNGAQLRPPMPRFRMTRQDAADVIAFLRSLE